MSKEKEKLYLNNLSEELKNPPRNKYILVYTERKNEGRSVKKSKGRITLKQIVDTMNDGFKRTDAKMDIGFKQVNMRLDHIESRLDYIVKANNLKDLPKSK